MPLSLASVFRFHRPSLQETRDGTTLLVFGDLGRWMVVDQELLNFLGLFQGRLPLMEVIRQHARLWGKAETEVVRDVSKLIPRLLQDGVLTEGISKPDVVLEPVRLANLTVNLTNKCNLRCGFCYNAERQTQELDVDVLMESILESEEILSEDASFIILGGEPFLDPHRTLEAVSCAEDIFSTRTLIATNGTCLTDQVVEMLAGRNVEIQVSLDSAVASEHDAVRGTGVFDKAVSGVRKLVAAGIPTILSMVYTPANYQGMEGFLELASQLGVSEARFIPLRGLGRAIQTRVPLPNQYQVFQHLIELLQRRPELRKLLVRDYFSIAMTLCRYSIARSGCGVGRKVLFVDADGTVYPCPNHVSPDMAAGRLPQQRLDEIFERSALMNRIREEYRVDRYERCRECAFMHWCAGDCRGEVRALTGSPSAPSPHCEELQLMMKEMFWLVAQGDKRLGIERTPGGIAPEDTYQV